FRSRTGWPSRTTCTGTSTSTTSVEPPKVCCAGGAAAGGAATVTVARSLVEALDAGRRALHTGQVPRSRSRTVGRHDLPLHRDLALAQVVGHQAEPGR